MTHAPLAWPVRRLRADDAADWRRLWRAYNIELPPHGNLDVAEACEAQTWSKILRGDIIGLTAVRSGRPAGIVHLVLHDGTSHPGCLCQILDVYVDVAMRQQGVGRALITAASCEAREAGAARLYLHLDVGNAVARRLYQPVARSERHMVYVQDL